MMRHLRRRRWTLVVALALIVAGATLYVLQPSDDARSGSEVIDADVAIGRRMPPAFSITYRIEIFGDGETSTTTEDVVVRRPFDARVTSGATENVSTFGRYAVGGQSFYVPPGAPVASRRPDAVLPEAVDASYAQARESRRVAGRDCRIYRVGGGAGTENLVRLPDADTYTDVCVDRSGLILEEVSFEGEDLRRRAVAEEVSEDPPLDSETFDVDEPDGETEIVGSLQELAADSRLPGETFWHLSEEPKGFELRGRYAVVPPGQPGFRDVSVRGSIVALVSEVWTDGVDLLVIDQGATQGTKPFEPDPNAVAVDGDRIGEGEALYSLRESEVRFLTGGSRFVRVRGTLPPSRLLAIARSLEETAGGPLQLKDG